MFCFPASDPTPQVVKDKEKTMNLLKEESILKWKRDWFFVEDLFQDKIV